ncbi:hypothetical protein Tco_1403692 [Tanacetum coccineum]
MDWCSYALESMIIYINLTVSEIVKVEKTVPAFMSWNSNLMLKREQEEIKLGGFGCLPIVEGLQVIETKNLIENRSVTEDVDAREDVLDKNEDFKSLNSEFKPEDKELKKMIKERNKLFLDFYKEEDNNGNVEGEEIDGDKNGNTNETECDTDREEVEGNKDECEEDKGNEEQ